MRGLLKVETEEFGSIEFQSFGIDRERAELPLCDIDGKAVSRVSEASAKFHFENAEGKTIEKDQVYRLDSKGQVVRKLTKTKTIKKHSVCPSVEAQDLLKEHYYQLVSDTPSAKRLMDFLTKEDKALKFVYSNGNGYKAYIGYLIAFQGVFVMELGLGYLSEQIKKEASFIHKEERKGQLELVPEIEAESLL